MSADAHADAVVIGAGPNGLVAANLLADAGWDVIVLEAQPTPGGAVRTEPLTAPGFAHDVFSAFYPMAAASPVIRHLELGRYGLRWTHAPHVLAHPRPDAPAAVMHREVGDTVARLELDAAGDGAAFGELHEEWCRISRPFMDALLRPFPPVGPAAALVARAGMRGTVELARTAILPLRRFIQEHFDGASAGLLFAGNALHADLTPESAGSALFGRLLVGLGQQHGFPVPVGGAGRITDALVGRGTARGVRVRCGRRVERVVIESGRAVGCVTADGERIDARRAIVADCDATRLLLDMVGTERLPARVVADVRRIQRSSATIKVDWALSRRVPWRDEAVTGAGTVHITDSLDELTQTSADLATGTVPAHPFLLIGQMTTADPTRSPPGTEAMWAYSHVPAEVRRDGGGSGITGRWDRADVERFADRVEDRIEAHAPGFRDQVIARHVMGPHEFAARNENLVDGDISGGTTQLHQQLVFRPVPGCARAETPIARLYLASASAHPGGAVHGAPGANAARAALLRDVVSGSGALRARVGALRRGHVRRRPPELGDSSTP